jgi:hypothetical protein
MTAPVEFTEDRIPADGLEESVDELVELFGGEVIASRDNARDFLLPLRRGVSTAGAVECTVSWTAAEGDATVTLTCNRDVDAPRGQRIALLVVGVLGALLFTIWPFFPHLGTQLGALAWIGGAIAVAVYLLTLRRTSAGIGFDFLRRLADRQRALATDGS